MVLAGVTAAAIVWTCVATAGFVFFNTGSASDTSDREFYTMERWLQEAQAKEALSSEQLNARTDAFQKATVEFERRHQTLETMLSALKNGGELDVSALRGDSASLLVTASIDEADSRQSQQFANIPSSLPQVGLSGQVSEIRVSQAEFLNEIEDIAVERAESARGVLRLTKVGASRIESGENMGGPAIEFAALTSGNFSTPEEAIFAQRVAQVAARMEEARYFETLVNTVPLGNPIGVPSRLTSPFGIRSDPFTRRPNWHNGIDLAAYWNAPIIAAGPGEVIFAGRKGGAGIAVEIDHGNGFTSQYAHLKRATVKRGDKVALGDQVGLMGSTGRSTGPHLHYEVHFNGKAHNPVEFMKAGKHVHQD